MNTDRKQSLNEIITEKVIEQMETAGADWLRPFAAIGGAPINVVTGNHYLGGNNLMFSMFADCHVLGTYKQWASIGAQVRKGEKALRGFKYGTFEKENKKGEMESGSFASSFAVFTASQVDNLPQWVIDAFELGVERVDNTEVIKNIDSFVANTAAKIERGNSPCYIPSLDQIEMPDRDYFIDTADATATDHFYGTLLHELTHWTKAPHRLDRKGGKRFGDPAYAFEELIAELGSAMLCARLGLNKEPRPDHAKYLNNWLTALKNDSKLIWDAAKFAQAAVDHLFEYQPQQLEEAA